MERCPNCGFSYAWDGRACGHCRAPESRATTETEQNNRVQARILHNAGRHGLPGGRTYRFEDLEPELREGMLTAAGDRLRGRPVLAFVDCPARWTLLTTREVISRHAGQLVVVSTRDLASVSNASEPPVGASREEFGRWKGSWEYLWVVDRNGGEGLVWVPCGGEAYALWNILLRFVRSRMLAEPLYGL
jgi:hypothetical protein